MAIATGGTVNCGKCFNLIQIGQEYTTAVIDGSSRFCHSSCVLPAPVVPPEAYNWTGTGTAGWTFDISSIQIPSLTIPNFTFNPCLETIPPWSEERRSNATMASSDPWFKDLGKEVTLVQLTPAQGHTIDTANYYNPDAPKNRQIKGKIVGTNGSGQLTILFDKPLNQPAGYANYVQTPNMGNIAMEFREEVQKAAGQNRFITLAQTSAHIFKMGELKEKKARKTVSKSDPSDPSDDNQSFFEQFKSDSADAAFRVASDKIAEGVRSMIAFGLAAKLGESATAASIDAVLNTPMGKAMVQASAGYALTYLAPKKIKNDPRVKKLAKEFRVAGMATAGGFVAGELIEHLTPIVESALEMLPGGSASEESDSKVRVTETAPSRNNVVEIAQADEEEDSETEKSSQRMVAGASSR